MFDLIGAAQAQAMITPAAVDGAYTWVCTNKSVVEPVLESILGFLGVAATANAIMKKLGVTKDSPVIGAIIPALRMLVLDVHPPDHVIVSNAATVLAASPAIVAATKVDPAKVAAAAVAIEQKDAEPHA